MDQHDNPHLAMVPGQLVVSSSSKLARAVFHPNLDDHGWLVGDMWPGCFWFECVVWFFEVLTINALVTASSQRNQIATESDSGSLAAVQKYLAEFCSCNLVAYGYEFYDERFQRHISEVAFEEDWRGFSCTGTLWIAR